MPLTNLPNELLLATASFLEEESDLLSFAKANRRTYGLLIDEVYKYNIRHNKSTGVVRAASTGQLGAVKRFIAYGFDTHVRQHPDDSHSRGTCAQLSNGIIGRLFFPYDIHSQSRCARSSVGNAIWHACKANAPLEVIARLIDAGVSHQEYACPTPYCRSWIRIIPSFQIALLHQNMPLVRLFLDNGAKLDEDICYPLPIPYPLHIVSFTGPYELVQLLLEHGADPNLRDRCGKDTALHYAAGLPKYEGYRSRRRTTRKRQKLVMTPSLPMGPHAPDALPTEPDERSKILTLLLEHGADPKVKNYDRITPLNIGCVKEAIRNRRRARTLSEGQG